MKLTKISGLTGQAHTLDIPDLNDEDYYSWIENPNRPHVQDAFPHLSYGIREFILSGITSEEWEMAFGDID